MHTEIQIIGQTPLSSTQQDSYQKRLSKDIHIRIYHFHMAPVIALVSTGNAIDTLIHETIIIEIKE